MAEILGTSGVGVSKNGASAQDPGVTQWQEDLRDAMETSDALFFQYEQTDDIDFLNEAIALAERALTAIITLHPSRAVLAAKLCKMFGSKFEHAKDVVDLDMAWAWGMEEMDTAPGNTITYATACSSILTIRRQLKSTHSRSRLPGMVLFTRYEKLGNVNDLNEAIIEMEEAMEACHPGDTGRVNMLNIWSIMLSTRFERLGDINDLEMAADMCEEVLRRTVSSDPSYVNALGNLGAIFLRRFERIGDLGDLQKAIKLSEGALAATPQDHPDRSRRYHNLAAMFSTRFKRIGDLDDLQTAIRYGEEELAATPQDHPDHSSRYHNLAAMFFTRFKRIGGLDDLQKAIRYGEEELAATPQDHPDRSSRYHDLAAMLSMRFKRIGDPDDLQKAIKHSEEGLAATPRDHPDRAGRYDNLGAMFYTRFERIGDIEDLQKAIKLSEEALAATPHQGHPDRAHTYHNLGVMFSTRFIRIGDLDDLQKAIKLNEEALAATPQDHPDRAGRYHSLAVMFSTRFDRIGDLDDLQKAINISEAALTATPRDHPDRAGRYDNLGPMFARRFERIGDPEDLQKAINLSEEAVAATPQHHPDRAGRYYNLGGMFYTRFMRIGDLGDLQKAIKLNEEALAATPQYHQDRAGSYDILGAMFSRMFERTGDLDDLQKAINLSEEALAATPQDHPDRSDRHSNRGAMFHLMFERIGDLLDLQKAIRYSEEAVAATPQDHPGRAGRYNNLGIMLTTRFKRVGDLEDLQKAINLSEEALAATPRDHPDRAGAYLNLGLSLESRYMHANSVEDFNECLRLYHQGCHCRTSPPRYRIRAARRAAHLLYSGGRFHESSSILEDAIHLMPSVNLQFLKRDDQQHMLSELSGLASTAASMALQAGREAYHSLKLLELGRGIIMGFTIDSRSEVSDLKVDHELEYDQFHRLRVEIDSPMDETISVTGETQDRRRNRAISRRREAVNEMEKLLTRIRNLPSYSGFLLPPSREALMNMAANGPIVIFNSTFVRSDAIIVTTSAITSLELPKLNQKETDHWMTKLASFGGGGWLKRVQDNKQMKDLLVWLWDSAVGPVFDHLECTGTITSNGVDNSTLKRIWWIGVGQLSMAPFHAAGDHSRGSTRNSSSRAVSTYIPTIKALSYARQKKLQLFNKYGASLSTERVRKSKKKKARLLLVPMPKTPGAISLPGVEKEVQYIHDSVENAIEITKLSNPTPAEVLKQVQHHDIAHFACHGMSDINPSDSHLVLLTPNGNNADKLLARDISSLNTPGAQLAYLSACSSAKNASTDLADEVIHLASAFQLAGFSHTLANLWETEDAASSEVARDFYNLLFQDQENVDDHYRVAAAFHEAVKRVRDKRPNNYLGWGPFVHTGA